MRSYKVKEIVSNNAIKLDLPSTIKIYPAVNMSKVQRYNLQIKRQRKEILLLIIIVREKRL